MRKRILLLLPLLVAALSAPARDKPQNWLEVRSPHFLVVSNGGEKQVRKVADQFERMRAVFHLLFPNLQVDPGIPIVVLAIKDEKDFRALEPQEYLGKGKLQLGGLFLRAPDKNYILMRMDAAGDHPYSVVYHEYNHLLTSKAQEWLPLWLNEGLAEFFQNTEIHENDIALGQANVENIYLLRQNRLLPLTTLFTVDHTSPYYHEENKGSIFYAESWAMTHYFEIKDRQENTHRLGDYVQLVSQKVDSVTAATRAFGDLQKLQKALADYVEQGRFNYFTMTNSIQVDDSAFTAKPMPEVQADAVRADFLAYDERLADSAALLDEVLKEDPQNASARETKGFLAFHAGHIDEARKWYAEAVKLDSQSYLAHYYFAAMSMNESLDEQAEAQVESSLRTSIKLNPNFAPSYDRLAVFLGMRNRNLDEAHMLTLAALQLDPADLNYRLDAANIMLTMHRPKDAIRILQNAMNLVKSPADQNRAELALSQAQNFAAMQEQVEEEKHSQSEYLGASESQESESGSEGQTASPPHLARDREKAPSGPHRSVVGTVKDVKCVYPAILDFSLSSTGHSISLHSENYFKVQFSALNFTPVGNLNPCAQLEGATAKVEYIEPADKTAPGWIVAVELRK